VSNISEGYYEEFINCSNCKKAVKIEIPEGTTVEDYLEENKKCPNCGCDTLYYGREPQLKGK